MVINGAEGYGERIREKDQNKWVKKYSWKFVFEIAARGRDKWSSLKF